MKVQNIAANDQSTLAIDEKVTLRNNSKVNEEFHIKPFL